MESVLLLSATESQRIARTRRGPMPRYILLSPNSNREQYVAGRPGMRLLGPQVSVAEWLARLTAVCKDPGSNHAADSCVYRDSCCDMQS